VTTPHLIRLAEEIRTVQRDKGKGVGRGAEGRTDGAGVDGAGDKVLYWIDPLGAMLLATYITWNWGNTAIENIKALVGLSATPEFLQKLTFLCFNHHSEVMQIDTVRALFTDSGGR
jgi:hypothetical protein